MGPSHFHDVGVRQKPEEERRIVEETLQTRVPVGLHAIKAYAESKVIQKCQEAEQGLELAASATCCCKDRNASS